MEKKQIQEPRWKKIRIQESGWKKSGFGIKSSKYATLSET
jgi:hypothetical protein